MKFKDYYETLGVPRDADEAFDRHHDDERDDDEPYAYTVHATEEAARAALGEKP